MRGFFISFFMSSKKIPELDIFVNNVFCIGRNYALHAKELGNKVPDEPMVFLKPNSSICFHGDLISLPPVSNDVHHEVEMVVAISKKAKNIQPKDALDYVAGIGVGIDFTARDLQQKAKNAGHPWTLAKGFDGFAPIGNFIKLREQISVTGLPISLTCNNEIRQEGNTSDMIFPVEQLIAYLSNHFTLSEGDLIFTGTPDGVSKVSSGDKIKAVLGDGLSGLEVSVK